MAGIDGWGIFSRPVCRIVVRNSDAYDRRTVLRVAAGAAGAGMAGLAGCAAGGTDEGSPTDDGVRTVDVGPDGELVFDPEEVTISVGETVRWVWETDTHNIVVDSQPEGANWEGTEGDASTVYDTGHEYEYTFETAGTYEYICAPHESVGMVGTVEVEE